MFLVIFVFENVKVLLWFLSGKKNCHAGIPLISLIIKHTQGHQKSTAHRINRSPLHWSSSQASFI